MVKKNLHCTELSREQRTFLLYVARTAVAAHLDGRAFSPAANTTDEAWIHDARGAFVTLRCHSELRGCIGITETAGSMAEKVMRCAILAATEDPRFPPLTREELRDTQFEISLLSVPHPIARSEDVRVGEHGVVVAKGGRKGLLLPQVAVEQGWSAEEFLDAACLKAGLAPGAWQEEGVLLQVFNAEVFAEQPAQD